MKPRVEALIPSPFLRFMLAGGFAAAINIASRIALSEIMSYSLAVIVAYLIAMTFAYFTMKLLVFDRANSSNGIREYLRFGLVNLVALGQVWIVSMSLAAWVFPLIAFTWHAETVAHLTGVLSPVATSYIGHKTFTFSPSSSTR